MPFCGLQQDDGDGFADPLDPLDNLAEDSVDQCLSTRAAEALGEDAMECLSYEDLCKVQGKSICARCMPRPGGSFGALMASLFRVFLGAH